jgi:putative membrane protein
MENPVFVENQKKSNFLINAISIAVPVAVVALLGLPKADLGDWTRKLPHAVGFINTLTTIALILGLIFIKQKKIGLHRLMMSAAFGLGALFLVCYVLYHLTNPANKFIGQGAIRYFYFFTLFTHIALSLVVLPLVLRAMFYAVTGQFASHRKIVRYAYPIWLYVSLTGVIVYLLVYQFYPAQ